MRRAVLATVLFAIAASIAVAQSDRGTITGTVSDPAGAVIASAPLQARNVDTGALYEGASSTTGNYTLGGLPVGNYEITVSVQGFKKYVRAGLQVGVAQTLRVDIPLEVGSTSESVTVTESAPLLKTESGELSHTVNVGQLNKLPLFVVTAGLRNPYRIVDLIPGTVSASDIRVNGAPSNSANYRIEGQDASNAQLPSFPTQNQPSVDAIQEVAVQTSNFAAEYGQVGGGVFNITMRSGTNQYHGSAYEYLVNEALNAGQPYTNNGKGSLIRPVTRRNDYGYTVGGPVWIPKIYDGRDKSFFFISWEQYKVSQLNSNDPKTVPTTAYRTGDFRAAILPNARVIGTDPLGNQMLQGMIYDPTDFQVINGSTIRKQFPNNSIPVGRFDPVSVKLQNMFPAPIGANSGALINNFINPYPSTDKRSVPSIKVDQSVGTKAKFSFFWQRSRQDTIGGTGLQQGDGLPGLLTTSLASFVKSPLYRLNFDYTLTPTMLLHLGAGYRKTAFATPSLTADGKVASELQYDAEKEIGLKGGQLRKILPRIAGGSDLLLGGMKDFGETTPYVIPLTQTPTFVSNLTWVKNNHTLKFGSEFKTEGSIAPSLGNDGTYTFAAQQTGQPFQQTNVGGANVGLGYASFLLGLVNQIAMTGPTTVRLGKKQFGIYAQDTWKVTRKLTLDYGVRYDYSTYLQEQYGRAPSFSPYAIHPKAGIPGAAVYDGDGPLQCNCNISHNYPFAFAPRLGLAYQINSKTVLRAGFGVVYNGTEQNNGAAATVANSSGSGTAPTFGSAVTTLSTGYLSQFNPRPFPTYDAAFFPTAFPVPGTGPTSYDRNAGRPARQYQWSVGFQREITRDLVVEASYVGNRGIWWQAPGLLNYNAITYERLKAVGLDPIVNLADRTLLTSATNSAAAAARGFNTAPYPGFPLSQTVFQRLRPFPQFTTIPIAYAPLGKTWYDSLQVKVDKRFSHGLAFGTAFTWGKNLIMGADREPNFGTDASGQANDVFNRQNSKYISSTNQPLVFVTSFSYTTPRAPGNKFLGWATRDWNLAMFVAYRSGQPYLVPSSQGLPGNSALQNYLGQATFANRVPGEPLFTVDLDCHCYDPRNTFVLNPKAWVEPAPGTFGNSAAYYTDYRQQRRPQENLNVGRTFRFTESITFSIRAEFSNIFNRAFIQNVGTGAAAVGGTPTINNLTNATTSVQTRNPDGTTASGFGALLNLAPIAPRQGNIVARITF